MEFFFVLGSQKEELENELDELVKKHETELKLLEKEYNITSSLKKGIDRVENDEKETQQKTEIFSTDTLASMSGKQLRELAVKCQLGKNGSREELLTKLIVFYGELSHKKKESEKENLMPRDDKNQNRNLLFNKYLTPGISEDFYLKKVRYVFFINF
jgi:phosphate starvation-inducible protein PhoH